MFHHILTHNSKQILNLFIRKNKEFIEQPIMKKFLSDKENFLIFCKAIEQPNKENKEALNLRFQEFYKKARVFKYLASLIHIFSIDFDKKHRLKENRYKLILDKPVSSDGEKDGMMIDILTDKKLNDNPYLHELLPQENLQDLVINKDLANALKNLTPKQKDVLELFFIKGYTNKEIATIFNETPQNISRIRKASLKKISKQITVEK